MWTSQQVLTATPVPPTITSLCSSVGHSHSTSSLAPGSFLPHPASLLLVLPYVLLSFPWPTPTRGGPYDPPNSSYDPDFRMAPPSFLSPIWQFLLIATCSSISPLQISTIGRTRPPFSTNPDSLISLIESIFFNHLLPMWGDCQQIIYTLFTTKAREQIPFESSWNTLNYQ